MPVNVNHVDTHVKHVQMLTHVTHVKELKEPEMIVFAQTENMIMEMKKLHVMIVKNNVQNVL